MADPCWVCDDCGAPLEPVLAHDHSTLRFTCDCHESYGNVGPVPPPVIRRLPPGRWSWLIR